MSFPNALAILASFITNNTPCEAGINRTDSVRLPFLHMTPRPGEQDPDGIFRTNVIACELEVTTDIADPLAMSPYEYARAVVADVQDAITWDSIFVPGLGAVDGCDIHETEYDEDTIERDKCILRFSIFAYTTAID